ncbi:MAG TPA: hypothetical protein VKC53_03395 [Patescibacteria group bacterium]|nr:hypothetical protein [Patescibacteria group bacterium]
MKIIVLHGDDSAKSYERLIKFTDAAKKRNWEIITDEFPNTPSLFGSDRLIIYRDFRLLTKKDINNFNKFDGTLVVYNDTLLPQTFLKQMPKDFKMEKYELPKILFSFLESFYPGNSVRALKLLHDLIKSSAVELTFFMLSRHLRDLYWVSVDTKSTQFPVWRLGKLQSQAQKFGINRIQEIINKLSDIDTLVKSSKTDLLTELDLLMLKQLK